MDPSMLLSLLPDLYSSICKDSDLNVNDLELNKFIQKVIDNNRDSYKLILNSLKIGSFGSITLAKSINKYNIKVLDLYNNKIGNNGISIILQLCKLTPSIVSLNISSNGIEENGFIEIANFLASNRTLTYLDMSNYPKTLPNVLTFNSATILADSLCKNRVINTLIMVNLLIPTTISLFVKIYIYNTNISHINYESNNLLTSGAQKVIDALNSSKSNILELNLANNKIGDIGLGLSMLIKGFGIKDIAESLTLSSIKILNLEGNNIGVDLSGIQAFSQALAVNTSIINLNISSNSISEEGGIALAFALSKNSTIEILNLAYNPLKNGTAFALADILGSSHLLNLDLSGCSITDEGCLALVSSISPHDSNFNGLKVLKIRENFISRTAGPALVNYLTQNHSLAHVDFKGNQLEIGKLIRLKEICERNEFERQDEGPKKLRAEVEYLKEQQLRGVIAEEDYQEFEKQKISVKNQIERALEDKQREKRRTELNRQLTNEKEQHILILQKIADTKELHKVNAAEFETRLRDLTKALDDQQKKRRELEGDLSTVQTLMSHIMNEKVEKSAVLKSQIAKQRQEKVDLEKHLMFLRREVQRLRQDFTQGKPILSILEQARNSLEQQNKERLDASAATISAN